MADHVELLAAAMKADENVANEGPVPAVVVVSHQGVTIPPDDDPFGGNENNARVAARMVAEKQRLTAARDEAPVESFHRAGEAPGDLSSGGKGGLLGDAATVGASEVADALAHASAWGGTAAAVAATEARSPKGKAKAASDSLLGDDAPAQ